MVFFLGVRESEQTGTIEPDLRIPPGPGPDAGLKSYVTTWDRSDGACFARRCAAIAALGLHAPINIVSILGARGLGVILGTIFSVLNLLCVGLALWRIDVMRGTRLFYNKIYSRSHFDYALLFLLLAYALFFALLLVGRIAEGSDFIKFIRIIWPLLAVVDIGEFLVAWVSTWKDYS